MRVKRCMRMAAAVLTGSILFTGCGPAYPDLTKEQEEQIANYMAMSILEYDKAYDSRLVDLSAYPVTPGEQPSAGDKEPSGGMDPTADTEVIDKSEEPGQAATMEELFGIPGIEIAYQGYELTDTYPGGEANEDFSLDAKQNNILLVLKFEIGNVSAETANVDLYSDAPRYRVTLNGEKKVTPYSTFFTEDMSTYVGTIEAGQSVPAVLLAEIPEDMAAAVTSIELSMSKGSSRLTLPLTGAETGALD